jgi:hypothetical protein
MLQEKKHPMALPLAAVTSFLLILFFEIFVFFLPEFVLAEGDFGNFRLKWKKEESQNSPAYATLFLGESFGWSGFKPSVYDPYSKYAPSFNLCIYQTSTFLLQYHLLKTYLCSAKTLPQVVLLEFSEESLFDPVQITEAFLYQQLFPFFGDDPELLQELSTVSPALAPSLLRPLRFPCWKRPMKGILSRLWHWESQKKNHRFYKEELRQNRGYSPCGLKAPEKGHALLDFPPWLKKPQVSLINTHYIEKILSLLQEKKIPVLLIIPSLHRDRRTLWSLYHLHQPYSGYLKKLQRSFSTIHGVCGDFISLFPAREDFYDTIHLHDQSATHFTQKITAYVNRFHFSKKK